MLVIRIVIITVMFCKDSSSDSERSGSSGSVRRRSAPRTHGAGAAVGFSAFRRSAKGTRHQKRMTKEEYHRLKHMVPSVSSQSRVSKVRAIPIERKSVARPRCVAVDKMYYAIIG